LLRITKAAVCWCYLKNKMKPSTKRNSPSHTHFDEQIAHFLYYIIVEWLFIRSFLIMLLLLVINC
jgi:hypothetical protein